MEEINNFQQEPDESHFHAWERFKELLMKYPQHYLTDMQEVILFYNGLDVPTRQILNSRGSIPTKTAADAKVGCELCKGPHYTKDCPLKEEGKTLEEAYYIQFGTPFQPGGQYRAAGLRFYQRNNGNSSYPAQRETMEESLSKFMTESAKRREENSNIIKEIRASTDAAIRNQGASIKTLELKIGQMSKVLQERSFRILPISTETNPKDQVKSISTATADLSKIRRMETSLYTEAREVKILDAIDHNLPHKEKYLGSFTLSCFINNVYFDKALIDLGASVSVMPFSTYINIGLGVLSHTRLTIELADRTIKQPGGIAKNVLVRIGKFVFPIDFIILDIPKDDDVPLILRRPFLSTAHVKINVFKIKVTLRVEEDKLYVGSVGEVGNGVGGWFLEEGPLCGIFFCFFGLFLVLRWSCSAVWLGGGVPVFKEEDDTVCSAVGSGVPMPRLLAASSLDRHACNFSASSFHGCPVILSAAGVKKVRGAVAEGGGRRYPPREIRLVWWDVV
ncbi:retrovirus-related pol polyprotein from transposon TNT 1-94 [Tanacetum coccineum]